MNRRTMNEIRRLEARRGLIRAWLRDIVELAAVIAACSGVAVVIYGFGG